jgi:hypothetical protein
MPSSSPPGARYGNYPTCLATRVAKLERAGEYLRDQDATHLIARSRGLVGGQELQVHADRLAQMAAAQQAIIFRLVASDAKLNEATRPPSQPRRPKIDHLFSDAVPF